MTESPVPLTALSEAQRAQAQVRFTIIRPALEDGVTQAQVARTHHIPPSRVHRWVKRYREKGLAPVWLMRRHVPDESLELEGASV